MIDVTSPVIQVVTVGVDWPAIAAAGATVIAAVGGIWGTSRQARRAREATNEDLKKSLAAATENLRLTISAEDDRARRTEKRQIYATYLSSFNSIIVKLREDKSVIQGPASYDELNQQLAVLLSATMEVALVAPRSVAEPAQVCASQVASRVNKIRKGELTKDPTGIDDLIKAMRADLGETNELPYL
jgi:hypothetical protein